MKTLLSKKVFEVFLTVRSSKRVYYFAVKNII